MTQITSEVVGNPTHMVDLVVVGSGAAGLTAALAASARGLDPLVIEKADVVGGTSAWSGGVLWIPANPLMAAAGARDSVEDAQRYLDAVVGDEGPATSAARREMFLRAGPRAIALLRRLGLEFVYVDGYPDYHPDRPGGHERGRSLNATFFDLRRLGAWQSWLRPQPAGGLKVQLPLRTLAEAPPLTRMLTDPAGIRMVLTVFARIARAGVTGAKTGALGQALIAQLLYACQRQGIAIWRQTPMVDLITDGERVIGVQVKRNGRTVRVLSANGVILAAGGFARNLELRNENGPYPASNSWTGVPLDDTGDAIGPARSLGAATALMNEAIWSPVSVLPDGTAVPHLWERSLPHSIMVDSAGARFCNESASYMEVGQRQYARHQDVPAVPSWLIIDARHRKRYPFGSALPGWTPREWLTNGYLKKAATLDELARLCGIDSAGLARTVARFNEMAATGIDADFHRGETAYDREYGDPRNKPNPCLGTVERAPFYAVAVYPGDVGTLGGLLVDEHACVLRGDHTPIDGLYAVGSTAATVMGRHYPGAGTSLGPAVVFGYVAANHAADRSRTRLLTT